jgi:hypothetical protein
MVSMLAIGPKVHGLKPGRWQWIFKGDKIRSMPSFKGEVKSSASCRKIPAETFLAKFVPASLLGVSAGICQRALVDESGMIRTQMGMPYRSENGCSAWSALYNTTP